MKKLLSASLMVVGLLGIPVLISAENTQPTVITKVAPEVREFSFWIEVLVGADGRVKQTEINRHGLEQLGPAGFEALERDADASVRQWVFMPMIGPDGKSRESWTMVLFRWKLSY